MPTQPRPSDSKSMLSVALASGRSASQRGVLADDSILVPFSGNRLSVWVAVAWAATLGFLLVCSRAPSYPLSKGPVIAHEGADRLALLVTRLKARRILGPAQEEFYWLKASDEFWSRTVREVDLNDTRLSFVNNQEFLELVRAADVVLIPDQHFDDAFREAAAAAIKALADPHRIVSRRAYLILEGVASRDQSALELYLRDPASKGFDPFSTWPFPVRRLRALALGAHSRGLRVLAGGWYPNPPFDQPGVPDLERSPRDSLEPEWRQKLSERPLAPHQHVATILSSLREENHGQKIQAFLFFGLDHLTGYPESLESVLAGIGFKVVVVCPYFPDLDLPLFSRSGVEGPMSHVRLNPTVFSMRVSQDEYARFLDTGFSVGK